MKSHLIRSVAALALFALVAAACAPAPTPTPSAPGSAGATPAPTGGAAGLAEVNVVMGYIPNIQFAPWYVAEKKGYFASEGIKVKFSWGFEIDGIKLLGANQADFALLGGDQVIQARSQEIPLVYVANFYNGFPITIFSLKEKNIKTPQDLAGKKVGLPAFWGASYTAWRALLYGAKVKESDVQVQDIGFAQVAAVTQGVVDAAAGYANNEPVQMRLAGKEINTINVYEYSRLVGIGLVTNEKTVAERPDLVKRMVRAVLRGVQDTINDPNEALTISLQSLPEAGGANLKTTQAVLEASVALWKNPRLGYVEPADWTASVTFMRAAGFIKTDVDVTKAYTDKFLP